MEASTPGGSPLHQRMIEDLRMRKMMPKAREAYLRAVLKFAQFYQMADRRGGLLRALMYSSHLSSFPDCYSFVLQSADHNSGFSLHNFNMECSPGRLRSSIRRPFGSPRKIHSAAHQVLTSDVQCTESR
jgi:hypothetical protein